MTDTSTAGWYPDPEGRPGLQRWWNGMGWSESVRPESSSATILTTEGRDSPVTQYGTRYQAAMRMDGGSPVTTQPPWSPTPADQDWSHVSGGGSQLPAVTRGGNRAAWTVGLGGALALALLITLVVFIGGSSDEPGPPIATAPEIPTRGPGQTRIVDEEAGVAYPYLGTYWLEFVTEVLETTSTAGQYIVTQEQVPTGGQFIAQVTSGPLQSRFGYTGPSSFATPIAAVQASVRGNYYPGPNEIETLRDEAVTVDGAAAYLLEFNLSWDIAGYDSTGERAALILIETGRSAPALVYISIPNTHAELYGIVDRVIAEIDVLAP
ncbi:MAG: DUF2510 domain-containing protein [Actinomycetota bacterium]|nr:DUF2510 domain-containing protein [Actinomycetota bacterium]